MSRTERDAAGHANLTAFSSSRVVGQKGYELTNHLGNVMAVISDKVTEQRAVPNASLPATAVKRAGLSAAFDYYPFGPDSYREQMPGRVVEDATVQCIPITRTRQVEKIVASEDQIAGYDHFGGGMPSFVASGNNTNINYPLVIPNPGNRAVISSIYNPAVLDANMTFTALPAGTTGLMVDVTVQENNHPSVTGYNRTYIGVGTLTVELRNLASGGIGTFLTTTQLTGGGTARLTVPPNMVAPGNVIRLWMHYDAPTFPTWMYDWGYTPQAQIQYSAVVKHILKPVDQQYVALSCDTDGAYAATYRYGFNGQQKDDEIKGKGNSLDFNLRGYDPRLGRFYSRDIMANALARQSSFAFGNNSPIASIDFSGALGVLVTKSAQEEGVTAVVLQNFTRVVSNMSSMLDANPAILKKMSEQTGFSSAEIKGWMKYGVGPIITVTGIADGRNDVAARGDRTGVFFTGSLIKDLSRYDESSPLYGAALFDIGMTVLHELTHHGDAKKNGVLTGATASDVGLQNMPSKYLHRGADVEVAIIGQPNLIGTKKDESGNWSLLVNGSTRAADPDGLTGLQERLNGGFGGIYNRYKQTVTKFKDNNPPADLTRYE